MTNEQKPFMNVLSEVLDVDTQIQETKDIIVSTPEVQAAMDKKDTVDDDFEYSRKKIKSLVDTGMEAVKDAAQVASETGEARHIEALSGLIKNIGDLAGKVLEVNKTKAEIEKVSTGSKADGANPRYVQNNIVFEGSARDLLKKVSKAIDAEQIEPKDER